MRAEGLSGNESDMMLAQVREAVLAADRKREALDQESDLDFDYCFSLAAPEEKQRKNEH